MRISKVKLNNYVCFYDAPVFQLAGGLNFVLGRNNSGKTALIGTLGNRKPGGAHRSPATIAKPPPIVPAENVTRYWIQYRFRPNEILEIVRRKTDQLLIHQFPDLLDGKIPDYEKLIRLFAQDLELRLHFRENKPVAIELPQYGTKCDIVGSRQVDVIRVSLELDGSIDDSGRPSAYISTVDDKLCWRILARHLTHSAYTFEAMRPVSDKASGASQRTLMGDASNLPQVLRTLEGDDRGLYRQYIRAIQAVFPEFRELRMHAVSGNEVEILVEYFDPEERRSELAVPLHQCGTGLGQVMAILYVVVTHTDSKIVLIDEPHSFLHPGAVRKLLEIFQLPQYSHHQYILTTHSPTALASVTDKTVLLLEREDMKSSVKTIDPKKNTDLELTLRSVGARLSDVFGMDNIIWVEGETDEACFPLILRKHNNPLFGTKILGVVTTGDLTHKKHGELAVKIYEKLSGSGGLLPPALGFIFDLDMKPKLKKLEHEFDKTIHFLSRQNFESYFLDFPEILEDILKRDAVANALIHSGKTVKEWISENNGNKAIDDTHWLESEDGAKFLNRMFNDLAGISYDGDKVSYGDEITKRILDQRPDHFQEIVDLISSILNNDSSSYQN